MDAEMESKASYADSGRSFCTGCSADASAGLFFQYTASALPSNAMYTTLVADGIRTAKSGICSLAIKKLKDEDFIAVSTLRTCARTTHMHRAMLKPKCRVLCTGSITKHTLWFGMYFRRSLSFWHPNTQ